jgi:hypothetical protein
VDAVHPVVFGVDLHIVTIRLSKGSEKVEVERSEQLAVPAALVRSGP